MDHLPRLKKFDRTLIEQNLDGIVVTHPANLRYLCGYTGSNGMLLFLAGRRMRDYCLINTYSDEYLVNIPPADVSCQ
jgi:Xaa-Pro aminopeptidase